MHTLLEEMSLEFEEAVQLGGGWTELALPSEEEAQRYFASFRRAPPDNSALVPGTQVRMQLYVGSPWSSVQCWSQLRTFVLEQLLKCRFLR